MTPVTLRTVDSVGGRSWMNVGDWADARALLAALLRDARLAGCRVQRLQRGPGRAYELLEAGERTRIRAYSRLARHDSARTLALIETRAYSH